MTCYPSQSSHRSDALSERERFRTSLISLIERLGCDVPVPAATAKELDAALATALMDAFRKTHDPEVYDGLIRWMGPQLRTRIRVRSRRMGAMVDQDEVWQDVIVNIYRYPNRFLASRPGAFAAWSSTIVDNVIRKHLRRSSKCLQIAFRDPELLQEQHDVSACDPSMDADHREQYCETISSFSLILQAYLIAFERLSAREQIVLESVDVQGKRYAEVSQDVGIRPEAIKMVVFRARKRIQQHLEHLLAGFGLEGYSSTSAKSMSVLPPAQKMNMVAV
jgi:RNA polymerase sigma factor (sigma-70 family)